MVIKRGVVGEYYGLQGTQWKDPPILKGADETKKIGKREFDIYMDGDRVRLVAWRTPEGVYWVTNTLLQTLSKKQMLQIARTTRVVLRVRRVGSPASCLSANRSESSGPAGSASSPPPASPSSATTCTCATSSRRRSSRWRAARCRSTSPACPTAGPQQRDRLHFTTDMGDVLSNAHLLFCCVDTPPLYSGDADLSRVERVVEELGDSRDHAIVMKSTVPVGTGRSIRRRRDDLGYVSNPEFLKEGTAVEDFMHPDRVVVGADGESQDFGDRVAALYEPLGRPDRPHGRRLGRDDQARVERLPRDEDLVHQRDRERVRGARRGRRRGRARHGPRHRGSARSSCAPASATAARASRRTSARSSSSPATRATTSSS